MYGVSFDVFRLILFQNKPSDFMKNRKPASAMPVAVFFSFAKDSCFNL